VTNATVSVAELRRWIGRTQASHRERGERIGNAYFAVLFVAIVGGIFHKQLAVVFWPSTPNISQLGGVSLPAAMAGGLYVLLRRVGPLTLSRPATSWLLTAPVSRRALLLPTLGAAIATSAAAGALSALAVMTHVLARPLPEQSVALPATGALIGIGLMLVALAAQSRPRWSGLPDSLAYLLLAAGLAGLVVDAAVDAPLAPAGWPPPGSVLPVAGALALVVIVGSLLAVRGLARTPNDRILEAATTAGTLFDSAWAIEPSFVTDMVERRYWARRRLRSVRLPSRVPVLVAQDLLMLRRRPFRLLWVAGSAALPTLFSAAPAWMMAVAVLIGGMIAAGVTTATLRTDAGNPWMLRMIGLSSRDAVVQRCWVPIGLATLWYATALGLLTALGELPAGPWWLLGVALGPIGGLAAVRKARSGFVDNGMIPLDTPMGSVSTGPVLAALSGVDILLVGAPALILMATGSPLSWSGLLLQAAASALVTRVYLTATTTETRVDLTP
jgi:hypothetical protein